MINQDKTTKFFMAKKRSVLVAYILWFLGGFIGIHDFYMGSKDYAFCKILMIFIGIKLIFFTHLSFPYESFTQDAQLMGAIELIILISILFLDLFRIPWAVEKYNVKIAQEMGE